MKTVKISNIKFKNDRKILKGHINAMAQSIQENGLLQPITIDQDNNVVYGKIRFQALKQLLGNDQVLYENKHYIQKEITGDGDILALIENVDRKNLTLMEKIKAIESLSSNHSIEDLSKRLNTSMKDIERIKSILPLNNNIKKLIENYNCKNVRIIAYIASMPEVSQQDCIYTYYNISDTFNQFVKKVKDNVLNLNDTIFDQETVYVYNFYGEKSELPICKGCEYIQKEDLFSDFYEKGKICTNTDCYQKKHNIVLDKYLQEKYGKDSKEIIIANTDIPGVIRTFELFNEDRYKKFSKTRDKDSSHYDYFQDDFKKIKVIDYTVSPTTGKKITMYIAKDYDEPLEYGTRLTSFLEYVDQSTAKDPVAATDKISKLKGKKKTEALIKQHEYQIKNLEKKNADTMIKYNGKIKRYIIEESINHLKDLLSLLEANSKDAYLLSAETIVNVYNIFGSEYSNSSIQYQTEYDRNALNVEPDYYKATEKFVYHMTTFLTQASGFVLKDNAKAYTLVELLDEVLPGIIPLSSLIKIAHDKFNVPKIIDKRKKEIDKIKADIKDLKATIKPKKKTTNSKSTKKK